MAQFTLNWDNTALLTEPNVVGQRASYRRRIDAGTFISGGFTPSNDLPKTAVTTTSPILLDNVAYQFKVETLCTENGPTTNSNGVQEQIHFACITPTITNSDTSSQCSIDVTGTDITKARFRLRKTSDNSTVYGPVVMTPVHVITTTIAATATGLSNSTSYYWQIELYAIVNGVEVISSGVGYLNAVCGPYTAETSGLLSCTAPEDLVVTNN